MIFQSLDVMFATLESWHQMNQAQFWQAFAVTTAKACSKLCLVRLVPAFHLMTPLGNWLYHSSKIVSVQPCCLFDLFVCLFTRLHPSDHCDCWWIFGKAPCLSIRMPWQWNPTKKTVLYVKWWMWFDACAIWLVRWSVLNVLICLNQCFRYDTYVSFNGNQWCSIRSLSFVVRSEDYNGFNWINWPVLDQSVVDTSPRSFEQAPQEKCVHWLHWCIDILMMVQIMPQHSMNQCSGPWSLFLASWPCWEAQVALYNVDM